MKQILLLAAVWLACCTLLAAEKKITAFRCLDRAPKLDGILDDECWQGAHVVDDFIQLEPEAGKSSFERTEVRVVFSKKDVYVGIKAFDRSPNGPRRYMARRDSALPCDWLTVWIDSLGDMRTAFQFGVNPSGVKRDVYWYDEGKQDSNWDPVWDVAVHFDKGFWSAEFKIPFSQLRFPAKKSHEWGFQVERVISRRKEVSYWAPVPRGSSRFVSLFGRLQIDEELASPRRLHVIPYAMGKLTFDQEEAGNPFSRPTWFSGNAGVDAKYGISSNFTLDATVNPDFGQVESDPSYINLSAYEVYLQEKRPFFIEGANIYSFSLSGSSEGFGDALFYSRRIGRSPVGVPDDALYSDISSATPIALALKLTGKTEDGWSIGVLEALTPRVRGDYVDASGNLVHDMLEPLTNWAIARVQKDFRRGRSAVGAIFTLVTRENGGTNLDFLPGSAVTGGFDFRHRWGGDAYEVSGALVGSRVSGSQEAIRQLQESSARYFQRPDNDYAGYDPTRTVLSGYAFRFSLSKIDGRHWLWTVGASGYSPGFEINDLGYLREADTLNAFAWLGYRDLKPNRIYRELNAGIRLFTLYTFAPEYTGWGVSGNLGMTLGNYWHLSADAHRMAQFLSWATLRGGPSIYMPGSWNLSASIGSDERKTLALSLSSGLELGDEELNRFRLQLGLTLRLRENLSFELATSYGSERNPLQYVEQVTALRPHWIFAQIDQEAFSLTLRLNYALTPDLTLQLYVQPFVASGLYTRFREPAIPRAAAYSERWNLLGPGEWGPSEEGYRYAAGGDFFTMANPDFNFQEFRLNAVLRWEYRPGSTLFLVWTQGRDNSLADGRFRLFDNLHALFGAFPTDVFLVKFTYWFDF